MLTPYSSKLKNRLLAGEVMAENWLRRYDMERIHKNMLGILLIFLLLLVAIPTISKAVDSTSKLKIVNWGSDPVTPFPKKLENGQIWTDKSVSYLGDGEFEVILRATGQKFKREYTFISEFVDVVLVLDISGSMDELGNKPEKFANMKNAAKNAVDIILGEGFGGPGGNRIALVKYEGMAREVKGFMDGTGDNKTQLKIEIEELVAEGGTNIQNGFLIASKLVENRENKDNEPVIILLSDGNPTYYHKDYVNHTIFNRKGDGTAANAGANHVMYTIAQAVKAKDANPDLRIYSIGFGMDSLSRINQLFAIATLMPTEENTAFYRRGFTWRVPFDHKYWEDESTFIGEDGAVEIFKAFAKVANDTVGVKPLSFEADDEEKDYDDVIIKDFIGEGFEVRQRPVVMPEGERLLIKGGKLIWIIDGNKFRTLEFDHSSLDEEDKEKIHQVRFKVKIKEPAEVGTYYTNKSSKALFSVADDNPYYEGVTDKGINENLDNKGWLTLKKDSSSGGSNGGSNGGPKEPENGAPADPIDSDEVEGIAVDDGTAVADVVEGGCEIGTSHESGLPRTGDDTQMAVLLFLMVIAIVGIIILMLKEKDHMRKNKF